MKPLHYLLLLALLLTSCSAEKRLRKLLFNHPEFMDTVTVTVYDTVEAVVEYVHKDTVFVPVPGDTVTIENEAIRVRYVQKKDTVWLDGECKERTIYVPVKVQAECPTTQPTKTIKQDRLPWWVPLVLMGLVATLVLIVIRRK